MKYVPSNTEKKMIKIKGLKIKLIFTLDIVNYDVYTGIPTISEPPVLMITLAKNSHRTPDVYDKVLRI